MLVEVVEVKVVVELEKRAKLPLDILHVGNQGQNPKVEKRQKEWIPPSIADSAYCYGILGDACIGQQILVLDVLRQGAPKDSKSWMEVVLQVHEKRLVPKQGMPQILEGTHATLLKVPSTVVDS